MTDTYTTIGPVRGCCDHEHKSWLAAAKCIARDATGAKTQGGYTDREIYVRTADDRAAGKPWLESRGEPSGRYGHRGIHCRLADPNDYADATLS